MKIITQLILTVTLLIPALAQEIADYSVVKSDPHKGGIGALTMNPFTFEIESIIPDDERLKHLNSPEEIALRHMSMLALYDPKEFERQHPKSLEEKAALAEAAYDITHPLTPEQRRLRQTPEQNALEDKLIEEMRNVKPVENPEKAEAAPGPIKLPPPVKIDESSPAAAPASPAQP